MGIDDSKPVRAYKITLESAFGKSITYTCTVPVHQGHDTGYTVDWRPTIATAFNSSERTLHVVFEEYTVRLNNNENLHFGVIYYNVRLMRHDKTVVNSKKIYGQNHDALFGNLEPGIYFIKVSKCEERYFNEIWEKPTHCISTISTEIDATITEFYESGNTKNLKVTISMTVVSVLVFAIASTIIYRKCRHTKKTKKTVNKSNRRNEKVPSSRTDTITIRLNNQKCNDLDTARYDTPKIGQGTSMDIGINTSTSEPTLPGLRGKQAKNINDSEVELQKDSDESECENTHSARFDFYRRIFMEINDSCSTICSSNLISRETHKEIYQSQEKQVLNIHTAACLNTPQHITYNDFMEKYTEINASSSSSGSVSCTESK